MRISHIFTFKSAEARCYSIKYMNGNPILHNELFYILFPPYNSTVHNGIQMNNSVQSSV